MLVFGKNDSCRLSIFLQAHMFWNFDHISRTYNQINNRNNLFAKVIIVLIRTTQAFFFSKFFLKKTRTSMLLSNINIEKCLFPIKIFNWFFNRFRIRKFIIPHFCFIKWSMKNIETKLIVTDDDNSYKEKNEYLIP